MKRPLFVIGMSFACTTWLAFLFLPAHALAWSGALAATGALGVVLRRDRLRVAALACLSGALALAGYAGYEARAAAPFLSCEGEVLEVQGIILDRSGYGSDASYTVRADLISRPDLPDGQLISVRTYGETLGEAGDTVRCLVRVTLPQQSASALYYRARGIALLGTVAGRAHTVPDDGFSAQRILLRQRGAMLENLSVHLSGESVDIVGAMVLGLQDDVPAELFDDLGRSGTSHLLAVSGLHLSILTAFVLAALERLRMPRVPRHLLAIAAATLFAALVCFPASVTRALVMTAMTLLARCIGRRSDSLNAMGLALLLICIFRPFWVLGRGLWLSCTSTAGIVVFGPRADRWVRDFVARRPERGRRFLRAALGAGAYSLCAYVFSLPVLVVSTGWLSLISPVANMLISPFVTPLILGGILCALVPSAALPMRLVAAVTEFCSGMVLGVSRLMAGLSFATVPLDEGYLLLLLLGAGAMIAVLYRHRADRKLFPYAALLLALCVGAGNLSLAHAKQDRVELAVIERCDTAVLLRGDQAVLLGAPDRFEISRLLRYLSFRGVDSISAVIAPGYPEQIDSGLLRLAERYEISCIVGPDDAYVLSMLESALPGVQVFSCGYADISVLGGVRIAASGTGGEIRVRIGGNPVLKTGQEYAIMTGQPDGVIVLHPGGAVRLPGGVYPLIEPLGRSLYGETRLSLHTT